MGKLKKILSGEGSKLKVLDIGTGVGYFIEELTDSLPGYVSIIGIDSEEDMLSKARENFEDERIEFRCMDAENLEFEDNSIDVVSISNTLHHLPNKEKVLNEIKRILNKNGIVIINEMISDNQSEKQLSHVAVHHLQGELDALQGICHNKTFTKQELEIMISDLNLEKVDMFEYFTHEEQEPTENIEEEKAILDIWFKALDSNVEKIKGLAEYEEYLKKIEKLKNKLYNVGYFNATEVMMVYRKVEF